MTNGFGRPTASRIAPRRNPSVAPAPTVDEGTPPVDNEPTLLDEVQTVDEPAAGEAPQTQAATTDDAGDSSSAAVETGTDAPKSDADATTTITEPADTSAPPAPQETAQEPQEDATEPPAAPDTTSEGEAASGGGAPSKARKTRKPRTAPAQASNKSTNITAPTTSGTSLVVIGPDGNIAVDDSVHVVDLRTVASETDPHALVDQLTALAGVSDSQVRVDAVAAITEAITKVALAN